MAKVLVIGDTHFPAVHKDYFNFVSGIHTKWKCDKVIHIGDVVDHHNISFHQKNPENESAIAEYEAALKCIKKWYKKFPSMSICIGNHDDRVSRLASDRGIPRMYIKPFAALYATPGWDWKDSTLVDGVLYTHGTGASSQYPAFNSAKVSACSTVQGHHHSIAGINWLNGPSHRVFGMNVGSMGYIGDLNRNNPLKFTNPGVSVNVRYAFTPFSGLKLGLTQGSIQANDANSTQAFEKARNLSFSSNITELSLNYEYYFFSTYY